MKILTVYDKPILTNNLWYLSESQPPQNPIWDDLQSYWSFDETSGGVAYDLKNSYDLTVSSGSWVSGKENNCYSFNGTQGSLSDGSYYNYEYTQPWSYAGWFYRNTSGTPLTLFEKIDGYRGYNIYLYNGTADWFQLNMLGGSVSYRIRKSSTVSHPIQTWIHFAITYNGNGLISGFNYYWDSVYDAASASPINTLGGRTILVPTSPIKIGGNTGRVDEVGLWNRVLTTSEISELYNSGNGLFYRP